MRENAAARAATRRHRACAPVRWSRLHRVVRRRHAAPNAAPGKQPPPRPGSGHTVARARHATTGLEAARFHAHEQQPEPPVVFDAHEEDVEGGQQGSSIRARPAASPSTTACRGTAAGLRRRRRSPQAASSRSCGHRAKLRHERDDQRRAAQRVVRRSGRRVAHHGERARGPANGCASVSPDVNRRSMNPVDVVEQIASGATPGSAGRSGARRAPVRQPSGPPMPGFRARSSRASPATPTATEAISAVRLCSRHGNCQQERLGPSSSDIRTDTIKPPENSVASRRLTPRTVVRIETSVAARRSTPTTRRRFAARRPARSRQDGPAPIHARSTQEDPPRPQRRVVHGAIGSGIAQERIERHLDVELSVVSVGTVRDSMRDLTQRQDNRCRRFSPKPISDVNPSRES